MSPNDAFSAQVLLMVGVAIEELQQSEAETDLARVRTLITNAQSTLVELHQLAAQACDDQSLRG